jgi:hypothetical protein
MKKRQLVVRLIFLLLPGLVAYGSEKGEGLQRPVPAAARLLVKRGTELAEGERFAQAISAFREAISLAPHYLAAHREYVRVKSYFMGEEEQVKTEYEALGARAHESYHDSHRGRATQPGLLGPPVSRLRQAP